MVVKRFISLLLATMIAFSMIPAMMLTAGADGDIGGIVIELKDPNTVEISGHTHDEDPAEIQVENQDPNEINIVSTMDTSHYAGFSFDGTEGWYREKWEGSGTEEDPFLIKNAGNLRRVSAFCIEGRSSFAGCYFLLTCDIDLSEFCGENINTNWEPIGFDEDHPFRGVFDGGGHTVHNLYYKGDANYKGLFGGVTGTIKNLSVNGYISANNNVGGIAGYCFKGGSIIGCSNYCRIEVKDTAGGIVGHALNDVLIENCFNAGEISTPVAQGNFASGGIVGYCFNTHVYGCRNEGRISGADISAGIVGYITHGIVKDCYNSGSISGNQTDKTKAGSGGIVGYQVHYDAELYNCVNTGQIIGYYNVGGVSGGGEGYVRNCTNYAYIYGNSEVGGIVGLNGYKVVGCTNFGEVLASCTSAGGITGKTFCHAEELKSCVNWGNVVSYGIAGGISASISSFFDNGCVVENCTNYGDVLSWAMPGQMGEAGGIAGFTQCLVSISRSRNYGKIEAFTDGGGFVGNCELTTITGCENYGEVSSLTGYAGGICGQSSGVTAVNCINTAEITGKKATGGLVGRTYVTNLNNSISVGKVYSDSQAGTVIGELGKGCKIGRNHYLLYSGHPSGIGGKSADEYDYDEIDGLSEDEYKTRASDRYVDWDFDSLWKMTSEGPRIRNAGGYVEGGVVNVSNAYDLAMIGEAVSRGAKLEGVTVRLTNDIDLGEKDFLPIGDSRYTDYAVFAGTFDGGHYTISGLKVNSDGNFAGLFGTLSGTVKNLNVSGTVSGKDSCGGIAGYVDGGTIENCTFTGTVSGGMYVGGLAGYVGSGTIENCTFSGSVTGSGECVGGIAGHAYFSDISKCSAVANVTGGSKDVGGIAGELNNGGIYNCVHTGTVIGEGQTYRVGGIVGYYNGGDLVNDCHSGAVTGYLSVGGVIGYKESNMLSSKFEHCYYLAGGLTYYTISGVLSHDDKGIGEMSILDAGHGYNGPGFADALTADEYANASSFSGWDFESVWEMTENGPAVIVKNDGNPVTFNANGAEGTMEDWISPYFGGNLPACTFTKAGETFIQWNTEADGSGTAYADMAMILGDEPLTLYAIFAKTEDVAYVDAAGETQTANGCIVLNNDKITLREGTYFAGEDITFTDRVEIIGNVTLIIKDGVEVTAPLGIHVPFGSSFTVYGQSELYQVPGKNIKTRGTGKLTAYNHISSTSNVAAEWAAIGGDSSEKPGAIRFYGCVIRAEAEHGAAIGGGMNGSGGMVTVSNACVYAKGGKGSAAIGGGFNGNGGSAYFEGGFTEAYGSAIRQNGKDYSSAAIGAGAPGIIDGAVNTGLTSYVTSFRKATVHAETTTGSADVCYRAGAIGVNILCEYDLSMIYPLTGVTVYDGNSQVDYDRIPWFCKMETVDIVPCTVHYGNFSSGLRECRYCGRSEDVCFLICDYNYDGSPAPFSLGVEPGTTVRISSDVKEPENKAFIGWNLSSYGDSDWVYPGDEFALNANFFLYAQWRDKTLTEYKYAGGTHEVYALPLTSEDITLRDGWYFIPGDCTELPGEITIDGDVNIILTDGCDTEIANGIKLTAGSSLSFYGQSAGCPVPGYNGKTTNGTGKITVKAGISGNGTVRFCGGVVEFADSETTSINCSSLWINDGQLTLDKPVETKNLLMIYGYAFCGDVVRTEHDPLIYGGIFIIDAENASANALNRTPDFRGNIRVYDSADAATPVAAGAGAQVCEGKYVRFEKCSQHSLYNETCRYCGAHYANVLDLRGSGDEIDPYIIDGYAAWAELARFIDEGGDTAGKYFVQTMGFFVNDSIGTEENPFRGIFDVSGDYALLCYNGVPFAYIEDAIIRNVFAYGEADTDNTKMGGLIKCAKGTCLIENCRSAVNSMSMEGGPAYYGGFIGECADGSNVTLRNCLFDGNLGDTSVLQCSGFVGFADSCTVVLSHCLMAGSIYTSESENFIIMTGNTDVTFEGCYYLDTPAMDSVQGARARKITGSDLVLTPEGTAGFVWSRGTANEYKGIFYAAAGEEVSFRTNLGTESLYAGDAEITRRGAVFTITMPDSDVTVTPARDKWFNVTSDSNTEGGLVWHNGSQFHPGDTVTIYWEAKKGYHLDSLTVTDAHGNPVNTVFYKSDDKATFKMPISGVHIVGTFKTKYSYDSSTGVLTLLSGEFNDDVENRWASSLPKYNVYNVVAEEGVRFAGDCSELFDGFINCNSFDLRNVDTSELTNADRMFNGCRNLQSVNFEGCDLSSLASASEMFSGCKALLTIDFSGWDTSRLDNISRMLYKCTSLRYADLTGLNLNAANVDDLFLGSLNLRGVKLAYGQKITVEMCLSSNNGWAEEGTFELLPVEGSYISFSNLSGKDVIYAWIEDVLGEKYSFEDGVLTLRWGDFSKDYNWSSTISPDWVRAVVALPFVHFVDDCSYLFMNFCSCESFDLNAADTSEMTDMTGMFLNCENLETLDLSGWDVSQVTGMVDVFNGCSSLESIDLSGWNATAAESLSYMFSCCWALETVNFEGFKIGAANDLSCMFWYCSSLKALDLSSWDTSNVETMNSMFEGCTSLESLDLSGFDFSSIPVPEPYYDEEEGEWYCDRMWGIADMFAGTESLSKLTLSPNMYITADMGLYNGDAGCGWSVSPNSTGKVISGDGELAVIDAPEAVTTYVWATIFDSPIIIREQPADATATFGGTVSTIVVAEGKGLRYQWYGKDPGGSVFTSTLKGDTYSVALVASKNGRKVWCVITDADGNTVTTRTATLSIAPPEGYTEPVITVQPENGAADPGEVASVTFEVEGGYNLNYQWFISNDNGLTWSRSTIKTNTYSVEMNASRRGRLLYCEVSDVYGGRAVTETVKIDYAYPEGYTGPVITTQPVDTVAAPGETCSVKLTAEGCGDLKYQWYIINAGADTMSRSSIKTDTYSVEMNASRNGRTIWCVVTDKYGLTAVSDCVTIGYDYPAGYTGPTIITQPADSTAAPGEICETTVYAEGVGELNYQWYIINAGTDTVSKSSIKTDTYRVEMNASRNGRTIWCVISDKYGFSVTSEKVTIGYDYPEGYAPPRIIQEPADVLVGINELASSKVIAEGTGLKYQWYLRSGEDQPWSRSSLTGDEYAISMIPSKSGRQVKCVITDKYGEKTETRVATLTLQVPANYELRIISQPTDCTVAKGETAMTTFAVEGVGLTYTWYGIDPGQTSFWTSTIRTGTYSVAMVPSKSKRRIYCVVTDAYGNTVTSDTVTLTMGN